MLEQKYADRNRNQSKTKSSSMKIDFEDRREVLKARIEKAHKELRDFFKHSDSNSKTLSSTDSIADNEN